MRVVSFENKEETYKSVIMKNTIDRLSVQLVTLQEQVVAITTMQHVLEEFLQSGNLPARATFEVHFQCGWPGQHPIMTSGCSVHQAYLDAVALWNEHNTALSHSHGCAEVFLCAGSLRVLIHPEDVAQITNCVLPSDLFSMDERVLGSVDKTVWGRDEELPGWYASKVTKHKLTEAEAVGAVA